MPEPAEGQVPAGKFEPVPEESLVEVPQPVPEDQVESIKTNEEIAKEVIAGKWSRGLARNKRLQDAGYDPFQINAEIAKIMNR